MHPIIRTLDVSENFITPNAARFLCHQAYINKVDLEEVDLQVLNICKNVQTKVRILVDDQPFVLEALEEIAECGDHIDYLALQGEVEATVAEALDRPIDIDQKPFMQFLVAFGLNATGEFHRPGIRIEDLAEIYADFGNELLEITHPDVPVHMDNEPVLM